MPLYNQTLHNAITNAGVTITTPGSGNAYYGTVSGHTFFMSHTLGIGDLHKAGLRVEHETANLATKVTMNDIKRNMPK